MRRAIQTALLAASALALVLALTARGIGDEKKSDEKALETGAVMGRVVYQGKPLPAGEVVFVIGDKKVKADISEDGSYSATVPVGQCKLAVKTSKEKAGDKPFVKIPEKYSDPDKSGLTVNVQKGKQTFDLNLN